MSAQLEFDFVLEIKESNVKKTQAQLPYFAEPCNDNEKLLNFQYEYVTYKKEKALQNMYTLGYTIAIKYIRTIAKKNKTVAQYVLCDKEEKAHNAIMYIITQYFRRSDFCITKSFTSYLFFRIKHELFYSRKVDKIVLFVDWETFLKTYQGKMTIQ